MELQPSHATPENLPDNYEGISARCLTRSQDVPLDQKKNFTETLLINGQRQPRAAGFTSGNTDYMLIIFSNAGCRESGNPYGIRI